MNSLTTNHERRIPWLDRSGDYPNGRGLEAVFPNIFRVKRNNVRREYVRVLSRTQKMRYRIIGVRDGVDCVLIAGQSYPGNRCAPWGVGDARCLIQTPLSLWEISSAAIESSAWPEPGVWVWFIARLM